MKRKAFNPDARLHSQRGFALILVLCCLVLLTGLVLLFLTRITSSSQLSRGSLRQANVDQFALSSLDIVTSSLRQEISDPANSTTTTFNAGSAPYTIYRPIAPVNELPARAGNPDGTPDPIPNLVRRSWSGDSALQFPSMASAVNSATDVSFNGRSVSLARWNSHYLIPRPAGADDTDSTPISGDNGFTAPDWVLVTDTTGPTVLTKPQPNVIGRYAYVIYDEGGLLDANLAGFPSSSAISQFGNKPAMAYADLTQLGLAAKDVDNLVGWRNYASVQPSGSFGSYSLSSPAQWQNFFSLVANETSGFLTVNTATWNGQTDQAFLNRQQLLAYRLRTGFPATALQYLGTFSRDLNSPSWSPQTPSGSTIDYAAQKDDTTSANRDVLGVRVSATFTRADGTTAQVGELLLKYRFPLNRVEGLSYQGVNGSGKTTLINGVLSPATAATIQRDFGLVWSSDHWNYCGPTGSSMASSIATLGSITNREPNFFELLKAAILSGSLGRDAGPNGTYLVNYEEGPSSGSQFTDRNADFQVIQIGANIIDQSDRDSYPTEIHLLDPNNANAETPFYGIENLPYLQRVFAKVLSPQPQTGNKIAGWYMAEIWNPHQNFDITSSSVPTSFRFRGQGLSAMFTPGTPPSNSASVNLTASGALYFTAPSSSCREPTFLTTDASNAPYLTPQVISGANGTNDALGNHLICGLYSGSISQLPDGDTSAGIQPQECTLLLEYQAPNGSYKIYNEMKTLTGEHDWAPDQLCFYYAHVDPRTDRFGTTLGEWTYASRTHRPGLSIRPAADAGWNGYDYFPSRSSSFIYPSNYDSAIFNNYYMGTLSDNVTGSNPRYLDRDGVLRSGEGLFSSGQNGRPLDANNTNSRPIIINRPFRNVGELGYAFRDDPWRNIDFFTPHTADAGLLDFFCIQESTKAGPLVAGTVSLNTRQAPVLQAILAGAIKDEVSSTTISTSDAGAIATALTNWTASSAASQGPFLNRSELLTKASIIMASSGYLADDQQIKIRREAALRALSDMGTTRTWNLMIDVVAQTGHYPPSATKLSQFTVDGEKRYWLHIAIDRLTGQVIDKVLEPVYE